jgi:hypothetical protein
MIASETSEFTDVLNRVTSWPPQLRITLARRVLESVERPPPAAGAPMPLGFPSRAQVADLLQGLPSPRISEPPKTLPMDRVVGILKPDGPAPSDEEYERILESELLRKYG